MNNEQFKYKPTTAFWKIHKLISDGLPKYKEKERKIFIIQGGQGAGKTISILMLIADYFNRNKSEITICSAELTKLKDTALNDFNKILTDWNIIQSVNFNKVESTFTKGVGHFVEFIGLDKADVGKGRRRRIVYINEANKITLKQFTDITDRAEIVLIDYNPDARFWAHDLINDFNFINLTFEDNEYLPENERNNILYNKSRGYLLDENGDYILDDNGNKRIISEYWANRWRVYGLGEIGAVEGRIYYWKKINYFDFLKIPSKSYYGVDWGMVDPFAVVECKYYDGKFYVHELNYKSENELRRDISPDLLKRIQSSSDEGLVTWLFQKLNIPKNAYIITDTNRPNKIHALRRSGWEYTVGVGGKSKLLDRVNTLQGADIYFTNTSKNIEYEQENYCYAKDRFGVTLEEPEDKNNHTIDAIAYCYEKMFEMGLIRNI